MQKFLLLLCCLMICENSTFALDNCFIAKENDQILINEGDCHTRYTPASTFKIALSLIGFDSGILTSPVIPS